MSIFDFIKEKRQFNLDEPETAVKHQELILKKLFLKKLYEDWYHSFLVILDDLPEGKLLEIGSGGGFLKALNSEIITSDILPLPHCDMTFSSEDIPFEDESLSAIFMMDVLHHIPDCEAFFHQVQRVLKPKGRIFLIEPANTLFSRLIFKKLHHEPFNENEKGWSFPATGSLSAANSALPWIVFTRDVDKFHRLFPCLKLMDIQLHTPFRYLLTGGLTYKCFVPTWSYTFFARFENALTPLYFLIAMFQTIQIEKTTMAAGH